MNSRYDATRSWRQPADMGVPEASQDPQHAFAVAVRGMRVARRVGVLVVAAVLGDPHQERPLDRHRAEDGEHELHHDIGLEGTVDKQPVVADRDPQGGQDVENQQESQIGPAESPAPDDERGCHHAEERDDDGDEDRHAHRQRNPLGGLIGGRQFGIGIGDRQFSRLNRVGRLGHGRPPFRHGPVRRRCSAGTDGGAANRDPGPADRPGSTPS
jgi:hypothetical protein